MTHPPTPEEEALLNRAMSLHQAGQVDQARSVYREVLILRPEDPDLLRLAGTAELQLGAHAAALELLAKSLAIVPGQPGALYNLGLALQAVGEMDDAVASYDAAIRLRPDYADAYINRGNALLDLGRYDDALASYDKSLAFQPEIAQTYANRAIALINLDKLEAAAACYRKALALTPRFAQAHAGLAEVYERQGDNERAVVQWSRMAEQFSDDTEEGRPVRRVALENMARILADKLGDGPGAEAVARLLRPQ